MAREENIKYYQSLNKNERLTLDLIAIKASNVDVSDIQRFAVSFGERLTQKNIADLVQMFFEKGILQKSEWYRKFKIAPAFLVNIFPLINDAKKMISALKYSQLRSFHSRNSLELLRDVLNNLFFEDLENYRKNELEYWQHTQDDSPLISFYEIITDPAYKPYLKKISPIALANTLQYAIGTNNYNLVSFEATNQLIEDVRPFLGDGSPSPMFAINQLYFGGKIDEAMAVPLHRENALHSYYLPATKLLAEDNVTDALKLFDKGIKLEKQSMKGIQLPWGLTMAIVYISALMRSESKISVPIFERILTSFNKNIYPNGFELIEKTILHLLGKPIESKLFESKLLLCFKDDSMLALAAIQIAYLYDFKNISQGSHYILNNLIEKADNNGFTFPALEAAFALKSISKTDESEKLYETIAAKVNYEPFLSKIVRVESWEKSLNLLLGMQSGAAAKSTAKEGASSRIVYFFNPKHNSIQPVLQTRQVRSWSKGRNISMKTFFEGKVQNMTEQDMRVSKSILFHSSYYYQDYSFKPTVFKELIGHPYLFLENANNIPIEFIEGKPQIIVEKKGKNYELKSNMPHVAGETKIYVEKETNTRYHIYDFSAKQLEMLRIVNSQNISIPDAGKAKLTQLLSVLSTQGMEVHSDLYASESDETTIENVEPDTKIRVQLLPFGERLRAELFSKPFGEYPPYCKPAKGGKVLIRNGEKGIQYQVKRDMPHELENETLLMNDIQSLETVDMQDGLIAFDDPMDSLYLLDILKKHSDICVVEWPEGERFRIKGTAGFSNLKLSLKTKTNWFDLEGELKVDEKTVLSLQQLLALTEKSHGRFVELSDGEFLALSDSLKKRLDELRMFSSADKKGISINKFASVALDDFFEDIDSLKTDKAWKEFRQRVKDTKTDNVAIPASLQAELRPYQEEGFRWMTRLAQWEAGACLADDMGLGKTIQTLAVLLQRAHLGAALVVCPVSLIGNWTNEITRFAPTLNVKTLGHGNRKQIIDDLQTGDVLITSYGLLQSEEKLFAEPEFDTIVLDEAHTIKNFATKTSKATMQLKGKFRIALTGTPIQNHLGEIWNLFNFINPGLLGNLTQFADRFVKPEGDAAKKQLKKLIAPFILRRTKSTVLDELPPKTEIVKKVQLSEAEMAFYEVLRRRAIENLSNTEMKNGAKHIQALAEITRLRQASCNPKLIDKNTVIPSAKLSAFLDIANELIDNKHRALVFSQFVTHLSIVREALDKQGISYQYLDGSTPIAEREKRVKAFQSGEGQLFLISLKAGGLGLNLTAADFVIHLDPWWNPAIEDQASDRAHRIGQKRPVTIYRLVAENTIEEKIIQLHDTKRDLAESLLEGSDQSARLSLAELMDLIKIGG